MKLGLLSTANINLQILAAAAESDRAEVVAVASRDGSRAQAYAQQHGIPRSHGTYEALLEDAEVDAVYVSLPNGMHHEWTMHALEAGKHVLCEKPYTRHPAEVEAAFDRAEAGGLVLMEAFMYRHHPQTREVSRLAREGAIGRVRSIVATFSFPLADLSNVRARPDLDGGSLMDVGCYCVSGSRLVAGEPVSAIAEQVTGETGIDMGLFGTLRFADDVVAQLEASFMAPERQRLEVVGDDGVLVVEAPWRVDWGGDVTLVRGRETTVVDIPQANSYRLELDNMADAIAGVAPPLLGRSDALAQARTIDGLYRAAEAGTTVTF